MMMASHQRRLRRQEQRYRDQLDVLRGRLAALTTAQQTAWAEQDPEPAGCVRLATDSPQRLWQASNSVMTARVGTTTRRGHVRVAVSDAGDDPLNGVALALARSAEWIPGAPVHVKLQRRNALCGPREPVLAAARALLMQLTFHYPPEHLELYVLCSESELAAWRWVRWLPHVLTRDGQTRRIAWDLSTTQRLLIDANPAASLVVLDNPTLASAVPPGVSQLLLADPPRDFSVVLDVGAPSLRMDGQPVSIEHVDTATVNLAERLARALASRRPRPAATNDPRAIVEVHLDGSTEVLGQGSHLANGG
jgi:DNA segregation ATPase FtsK/SpoIIIE-like protein